MDGPRTQPVMKTASFAQDHTFCCHLAHVRIHVNMNDQMSKRVVTASKAVDREPGEFSSIGIVWYLDSAMLE